MSKIWNKYQLDIFKNTQDGKNNLLVEALAGSGKTSTLLESLKYLPEDKTWLLVAFNKSIAKELKDRAPDSDNGEVSTLHSLGLKSLGKTFKQITVDFDKADKIVNKLLGDKEDTKELRYSVIKGMSLAKGYLAETKEEIDDVLDEHDLDPPPDVERDTFIYHIIDAMEASKRNVKQIDFDDMIWLPNVLKVEISKYDMVFIDESQDLNKAQIHLALKTVQPKPKTKKSKPEGRIIAYGDSAQAIYKFRGADSNAMNYLKQTLQAKSLPLSITYRCPLSVVKEAQKFVPALEAAPNAIEGKVAYISLEEMKKIAKPGCFILSRVNAPLIGLALGFLKQGIPVNIQGRDLGNNLQSLIKRSRCKQLDKFLEWLDRWSKKECKRLSDRGKDTLLITDKVDCLVALASSVDNLSDLKSYLDRLFTDVDDKNKIILSSVHRVKGMERENVFLLWDTFKSFNQEEKNIKYVGITRSLQNLYFVKSKE